MKKIKLLFAFLFTQILFSQIRFEKGYFIDNSGKRTECLIKNVDWNYNPTSFEYKLSDDDKEKIQNTILNVKEFGINDQTKYTRFEVLIDRSSQDLNKLGINKEPIFNNETLFLKTLVAGDMNLYVYNDNNTKRFFYGETNIVPKQLVYLMYNLPDESKVGYNVFYKDQIKENLDCSSISKSSIDRLQYKENSLTNIFLKYNECSNPSIAKTKFKSNNPIFNLSIRPRVSSNFFSFENSSLKTKVDFDKKINFSLGIEAELILPFNKNKWSLVLEPQYQYFKANQTISSSTTTGGYLVSNVNYKSIDLPIGIRHYLFLNNKSKLFINIAYSINLDLGSEIQITRIDGSKIYDGLEFKSNTGNFVFGIGYKYDKFSLEARVNTKRNMFSNYSWSSNFNSTSLILGYTIF